MPDLRVIADTNFLMIPGLFGVDIFGELDRITERKYRLLVPKPVVEELKEIAAEGSPRERSAARIALDILLLSGAEVVDIEPPADDAILKLAREHKYVVGTNDAKLRRKLRSNGIPVVYLRQKSHLSIDGGYNYKV